MAKADEGARECSTIFLCNPLAATATVGYVTAVVLNVISPPTSFIRFPFFTAFSFAFG